MLKTMFRALIPAVFSVVVVGCSSVVSGQPVPKTAGAQSPSLPSGGEVVLAGAGVLGPKDKKHPEITFDPCIDIPDAVLVKAGVNPAEKKRNDYLKGESYYALDCYWGGTQWGIDIASGAITSFERARSQDRPGATVTDIRVNKRQAAILNEPSMNLTCSVLMATSYGYVLLARTLHTTKKLTDETRCAGIEDVVRIIEPSILDGMK
ncbi:MAG: DUF3558 family protein [Mycobacteriaceae bacterium]